MDGVLLHFRKDKYMRQTYNQYPSHNDKRFCICDSQIDSIILENNTVRFLFSNGYYGFDHGQITPTSPGYIEFADCDPSEFTCYIIERSPSEMGAKMVGYPISLENLVYLLTEEERKVEIFLEMYDFNYLHWRGVLLPYRDQGLSDIITIEISGCYPMSYVIDDVKIN